MLDKEYRKETDGKICYIVGAGENCGLDFMPGQEDYLIAVDGGFRYLQEKNMNPDMVIGDFDSLPEPPSHPNVIVLDKEKDDTDMAVALAEGIQKGYQVFKIYGGTGGRFEHTLGNMQLLAALSQKRMKGFLIGRDWVMTAITDGSIEFDSSYQGYISVFSHSNESRGVYEKNLRYELQDAVLTNTFPLGVSNEFIGKKSRVSVEKGTLILVYNIKTKV